MLQPHLEALANIKEKMSPLFFLLSHSPYKWACPSYDAYIFQFALFYLTLPIYFPVFDLAVFEFSPFLSFAALHPQ